MKLTILQYITPSRLGGAEDYFLRLVDSLRDAGHRVIVVTKRNAPVRLMLEERGHEVHAWHTRGKVDPVTLSKLCRLIRQQKVDVINTHLSTASLVGSLAGKLTGVPVVAHMHSIERKYFFEHADYLVAVAGGVKDHLVKLGVPAHKIPVLYYGIDLERFDNPLPIEEAKTRIGLQSTDGTVGIVGHFSPRKGHRFLLQALRDIEPDVGPVHAVFAGEGDLEGELRRQAEELKMSERVHFLGFRKDVREVVSAFDVFALPSSLEGLSIAVMEAMALRRPVVTTAIAGMPEVVHHGETGFLTQPGDVPALAEALRQLFVDEQLARRLGENGRRLLEQRFDQRQCLADVEGFLQRVVTEWREDKRYQLAVGDG